MNVSILINEIKLLSIKERFMVMEETLASLKDEELLIAEKISGKKKNEKTDKPVLEEENYFLVSEPSLSTEWLSDEDNRWDKLI